MRGRRWPPRTRKEMRSSSRSGGRRVETVTNARHKGMLKVVLGEMLEHKRLFDQAASGNKDLIGKSLAINDHSGDVMPVRCWCE